jgi:hypothetical protein
MAAQAQLIEPGEQRYGYENDTYHTLYRYQQVERLAQLNAGDTVEVTYVIPDTIGDGEEFIYVNVSCEVESMGPARKSAVLVPMSIVADKAFRIHLPVSATVDAPLYICSIGRPARVALQRTRQLHEVPFDKYNINIFEVETWGKVASTGQLQVLRDAFELVFGVPPVLGADRVADFLPPTTLATKRATQTLCEAAEDLGMAIDAVAAAVRTDHWTDLREKHPSVISLLYRQLDRAALARLASLDAPDKEYREAVAQGKSRSNAYKASVAKAKGGSRA